MLKRKMNRRPHQPVNLLTVREVRRKKQDLHKALHNSISKKKSRIYDLTPKSKPTTNRIRGNGMTEEQVMKEILPFISGHGLKGDNHKIAAIVTRSLHAYPRLKHLYTNGLTHGNVQPPKPLHNSVKVRTVASASKILSV